ncbi:MAG: Malonyl-[acyl-carrier protein] O-methyltransferase [Planctomycetota bacterium]|jgi:SAM-dependent methyltransferase
MTALTLLPVACPLCLKTACQPMLSGSDVRCGLSGRFDVVRCQHCGHRYLNPRPADECLADCYPTGYAPHQSSPDVPAQKSNHNAAAAANRRPWYLRWLPLRHMPGLRRLYYWLTDDRTQPVPQPAAAQSQPPQAVLELGCAAGSWLLKLQAVGWSVCGVELCAAPADAARRAGLLVITGTLESASLPAQSFDLVAAWMVLEHTPDPVQTLTEIHRVLKPGGRLLFSVPNAASLEARLFSSAWYSLDLPRHLQHFDPQSILRILRDTGYEQIHIEHHRTLIGAWGSLGVLLNRAFPGSRLAAWLQRYPEQPRLILQLLSAPVAIILAWCGQGPGLTISARRPAANQV